MMKAMRGADSAPESEHPAIGSRVEGYASWLALAALGIAWVLPMDGAGLPPCWIKRWLGFPCLSCGLTRSVLHTLHGDWQAALQLHPLGPPLVAWCLLVAAAPLLPPALRRRGAHWLQNPVLGMRRLLPAIIALLLLNGLYRFWWILCLKRPSPW
jgi:Protein of unknown function (DUF2752)